MSEKDAPYRNQSIAETLWKKARVMFQEQLAEVYRERRKRQRGEKTDGILINRGTPHDPALLLLPSGDLKWMKSEWTPEPFKKRKIPDIEYCILATEIIERSPKPKFSKRNQ